MWTYFLVVHTLCNTYHGLIVIVVKRDIIDKEMSECEELY